jgi:two-component system LytT family sensor kinase
MTKANIDKLRSNRTLLFWTLNVIGWHGYGISFYVGTLLIHDKPVNYEFVILIAAVAGFLLTLILRSICRFLWGRPPPAILAGGVLAAYGLALVWRVIINVTYQHLVEPDWMFKHWYELFDGAVSATYMFACWIGLYFGFKYYDSIQREREAALRAMSLAQQAQLKMLRYQLNPHFLFNTLNAISTLVLDNRNKVANSVVTGLSDFLRYTLDQDPMKKVTLAQEVEALKLYLDIEKMRFGDRLHLQIEIAPEASQALVPSLLLQPLIENAIKYAVSPREQGGRLLIEARLVNGSLQLGVRDDGPGITDATRIDNGKGVGLRNTRERLQVLYGAASTFTIDNANPGLKVVLLFPAEFSR